LETAEVLDRMREGADRLRNNTNSFLSGELLGLVPVRISVSGESEENSLRIKSVPRHHPTGIADGMCTMIARFRYIFQYTTHFGTIMLTFESNICQIKKSFVTMHLLNSSYVRMR